MNTCVYRILAVHDLKAGAVLELKANQQYFTPKVRKGEVIEIDSYDGHKVKTRIKALVMMDDPHPDCAIGILLPKDVQASKIPVNADVWTVVK